MEKLRCSRTTLLDSWTGLRVVFSNSPCPCYVVQYRGLTRTQQPDHGSPEQRKKATRADCDQRMAKSGTTTEHSMTPGDVPSPNPRSMWLANHSLQRGPPSG